MIEEKHKTELGPTLNKRAPDFMLLDDRNTPTTLGNVLGERGALLAFIHGTWCPVCVQTLHRLRERAHVYAEKGVGLAVISVDAPGALRTFKLSSQTPISFPILADENEVVHKRYRLDKIGAWLLLDREAIVRHKFLDLDHHGWPGHKRLLEAVDTYLG